MPCAYLPLRASLQRQERVWELVFAERGGFLGRPCHIIRYHSPIVEILDVVRLSKVVAAATSDLHRGTHIVICFTFYKGQDGLFMGPIILKLYTLKLAEVV